MVPPPTFREVSVGDDPFAVLIVASERSRPRPACDGTVTREEDATDDGPGADGAGSDPAGSDRARSGEPGSLVAAERAWVAASYGDWEFADPGPTPPAPDPEPARRYPEPEPVTVVPGVDDAAAARLADGGVVSVRLLAAADPVRVARALGMPANRVTSWHWWARRHVDADPLGDG
jgi:hypothetical protein